MNKLAEAVERLYESDLSEEEYARQRRAYLELYYRLREKNGRGFLNRLSPKTRKRLHPPTLLVMKIRNRLRGLRCEVLSDRRQATTRPVIYAVTHIGKYDIEVVAEAIKEHFYLLSGDFEHLNGTIDNVFLNFNGVIYVNETDKEDRQAVKGKMIDLLRQGGSLMYYPEGVWNLSPNLPILPCNWGIVEVAQKANAIIIPISAVQYGKCFEIKVGENFDMTHYGSTAEEKARAIGDLRDAMAAMKWEIWERHLQSRSELTGNEWEAYRALRFSEWVNDCQPFLDEFMYKPKNVTPPEEAFAHLKNLIPSRENAFLFRKD